MPADRWNRPLSYAVADSNFVVPRVKRLRDLDAWPHQVAILYHDCRVARRYVNGGNAIARALPIARIGAALRYDNRPRVLLFDVFQLRRR